VKMVVANSSNV